MKHIYLIAFILFPFFSSAQVNYQEAVIVKNNGETIKGFVDYREWTFTPTTIDFKNNLSDKTSVSYTPATIRSFEVLNQDKYITFKGSLSMDKNVFPDLPLALDTSSKQDVVFLRISYQGSPVSLLEQADDIKKRYFIMDGDNPPVELSYHEYYNKSDNAKMNSRHLEFYKQTLSDLAKKYNPTNIKIANMIYDMTFIKSDIRKVVRAINNDNTTVKTGDHRFFIGVAVNKTNTKFQANNSNLNSYSTPYTISSISPELKLGVDYFINKNIKRLIIRAELSILALNINDSSDDGAHPAVNFPGVPGAPNSMPVHSEYKLTQYGINLSPQLIYNFSTNDNFKVFGGAGMNLTYAIYAKNKYTYGTLDYSGYFNPNSILVSFPLSLGVVVAKKVEVSVNYTTPVNISNSHSVIDNIVTTHYGLGISYLF